MLAVPPLPALELRGGQRATVESWSRGAGVLRLRHGGTEALVRVERCAAGRLRDAYPVAAHDVELVLETDPRAETVPALLRTLAEAVSAADPRCRRVVYAVPEGDRTATEHAEAAGFRYVVDIDVADRQLSLLVREPGWVTNTDMDLDHVPGT
ncbi:hypothetical protein AB0D74_29070 [Streptomyces sp. NPDC048278]|uniref:hypothetical protein n=1 Tax=Streptomyces sp. NPDC048278 TaxID=3155809 RepID=UPI0034255C7B